MSPEKEFVNFTLPTGGAFKLAVYPGPDPIVNLIMDGIYAYPSSHTILFDMIKPGDRVVDLGAHIGTFTFAAASLGAEVLAIEGSKQNCELIQASIEHNQIANVRLEQVIVTDRAGYVEFHENGPFGQIVPGYVDEMTPTSSRSTTLDDLVASVGWDHIDFIKMDIEGSEWLAINGMARILSGNNPPIMVYESNSFALHNLFRQSPGDLVQSLYQFGYTPHLIHHTGQLILLDAQHVQVNTVVDHLAFRPFMADRIDHIENWRFAPNYTTETVINDILREAALNTNPHRQLLSKALSQLPLELLRHPSVRKALIDLSLLNDVIDFLKDNDIYTEFMEKLSGLK